MAVYTIYKNGTLLFDGTQKESPALHLELNAAGSLEFTDTDIEETSASDFKNDTYTVFEDGTEIFEGRPTESDMQYDGRSRHYIEGAFGYLNDTCVTPFSTSDGYDTKSAADMLSYILSCHNAMAAENRQIQLGTVDGFVYTADGVTATKMLIRSWNYETCKDAVTDIRNELGGYMFISFTDGKACLNWYKELPESTSQAVELGKNITDFTKSLNVADIVTACIPIGPVIEKSSDTADDLHILATDTDNAGLIGKNLTLTNRTDVNSGVNYVYDETLVSELGYHYKKVEFQQATSAQALKSWAIDWIAEQIYDRVSYKVDVADLHYAAGYESSNERIRFATLVTCNATAYKPEISVQLPCSAMDIELDSAVKTITLGTIEKQELTEKVREQTSETNSADSVLQSQVDTLKQTTANNASGIASANTAIEDANKKIETLSGGSSGDSVKVYRLRGIGRKSYDYTKNQDTTMSFEAGTMYIYSWGTNNNGIDTWVEFAGQTAQPWTFHLMPWKCNTPIILKDEWFSGKSKISISVDVIMRVIPYYSGFDFEYVTASVVLWITRTDGVDSITKACIEDYYMGQSAAGAYLMTGKERVHPLIVSGLVATDYIGVLQPYESSKIGDISKYFKLDGKVTT